MGVSVTKTSASQASSYYKQGDPFFEPEANTWQGSGLDAVGLEAGQPINNDDFSALAAGINPLNGEQTIRSGYDPDGIESHKSGYDVSVDFDKTISICAFAPDDLMPGIQEAVHDAVKAGVIEVIDEYATARIKEGGVESEVSASNSSIIADFRHSVTHTDTPDPQIHEHVYVLNAVTREDGEMVSLNSNFLFDNQAFMKQAVESQLAVNLKELGYGIEQGECGQTKLAGVPQEVVELHSKRSQEIEARTEELRENGFSNASEFELKQIATLDTRGNKTKLTGDELAPNWDTERVNAGLPTIGEMAQTNKEIGRVQAAEKEGFPVSAHDHVRFAAYELAEEKSNFSSKDVLSAAMTNSYGDFGPRDINSAFHDLQKSGELVMLDKSNTSSIDSPMTTKEVFQEQKKTLENLNSGYVEPMMNPKEAQQALFSYAKEQQAENPDYKMSQADYDLSHKILTSSSPNLFLHVADDMERRKALEIVESVLNANTPPEKSGNPPATAQQHNDAVASIQRDLSRDAALEKQDREQDKGPDYEAMLGKETVDRIRQQSLKEATGIFKKAQERNVAEHIAQGSEDAEIFKATGARGKLIDKVREKLYSEAVGRATNAAENEIDRKTAGEKERHYDKVDTAGSNERGVNVLTKIAQNDTRAVLNVEGGNEELLYREKEVKGHEIRYDSRFKVGMLTYSVKRFAPEEKAERAQIASRNEDIKARKMEDAKQGILNTEKLLDDKQPGWSVSFGSNRSYRSWGGSNVSKSNQKVWFGADKGNTIKRHRTEHHGSYIEKSKTYDAKTGIKREISSSGSKVAIVGWTLFESKKSKIKETDKNGRVTHSISKTTKFMGSVTIRKVTKNHDGTVTHTTIKGYEKQDLFGRKTMVITKQESVTKEAKPSMFMTVAMSLIGGKNQSLNDYAARASERGKFVEIAQEGKTTRSKTKFNSMADIAKIAATSDYAKTSIMTYSRGRAENLNIAVRGELIRQGIIGKGQQVESLSANHTEGKIVSKQIELSKGDKIKLTDTSKGLGIKAGETGIVKAIDEKGNIHITLDKPREALKDGAKKGRPVSEVFINVRDYKAIDYNYASTSGERTMAGKLVVDYHSRTANKDFLAGVHDSIRKHGGDIRIAADKPELAKTQMKQYDDLKDKYRDMVEKERQSDPLIGKSAVVVRQAGSTKFSITNSRIVNFDHDKNTVNLAHLDAKGIIVTKTYNADRVRVDGNQLKLPESQVKKDEIFKNTVFNGNPNMSADKTKGDSEKRNDKSPQQGNERAGTTINIVSAETRILSPSQANREIAKLEKDTKSDKFAVIDADRLPPQQVNEMVKANAKMGNRSIIVGDAKEVFGKSAEQLETAGKGQNITNISKHPEVQAQKAELINQVGTDSAKKQVDKIFTKLEASGSITEVNGKENLIMVAMQEFSGKIEIGKTTILANKYLDKVSLHNAIRAELKEQEKAGKPAEKPEVKGQAEVKGAPEKGQSEGKAAQEPKESPLVSALNVTSRNGQQKTFITDAVEHGVGPAVVNAVASALRNSDKQTSDGKQNEAGVKIITTDKEGLKEQFLQALSKGFDVKTAEQKYVEISAEKVKAVEKQQVQLQIQQQSPTKSRHQQMEIGD